MEVCFKSNFEIVYFTDVVFFFKQKTAYEMRISDWSSDVCSSDLHQPGLHHCRHGTDRARQAPDEPKICHLRNLHPGGHALPDEQFLPAGLSAYARALAKTPNSAQQGGRPGHISMKRKTAVRKSVGKGKSV